MLICLTIGGAESCEREMAGGSVGEIVKVERESVCVCARLMDWDRRSYDDVKHA